MHAGQPTPKQWELYQRAHRPVEELLAASRGALMFGDWEEAGNAADELSLLAMRIAEESRHELVQQPETTQPE